MGTPYGVRAIAPTRPNGIVAVVERGQAMERSGQRDQARALYEAALRDGTTSTSTDAAQLLRLVARTYMLDANYAAGIDCDSGSAAPGQESGPCQCTQKQVAACAAGSQPAGKEYRTHPRSP